MNLDRCNCMVTGWDDAGALHVFRNMRAWDVKEIFATRPEIDPYQLFCDYKLFKAAAHALYLVRPNWLRHPVALFGVFPKWGGVGAAHLVATDEMTARQALWLTCFVRESVIPAMIAKGLHRVDCASIAGHDQAHAFLRRCGAKAEGERRGWGSRGEDFIEFRWLSEELQEGR